MAISLYDITFKETFEQKVLCKLMLSEEDISVLQNAIEDLYYFEFVYDDLPIRGFLGHLEEGPVLPHSHKTYLWTHLHFTFEYNGKQVISANVSTNGVVPVSLNEVTPPLEVAHTYSATWYPTKLSYKDRNTRQEIFSPKSLKIHWLSIINSVVLVILLLGFVMLILLRVLRNDFARYNIINEEGDEIDKDEYGWKIIHTDVFRFPSCPSLLCAILGVGSQFLVLAFGIIIMAMFGLFNVYH